MKLIIGNWKMYPTLTDSLVLAPSLKSALVDLRGVEVVLAPPTPWLVPIIESWKHSVPHIHFSAQNIWPEDQGAYTGEISAYLLKNLVQFALVGHSERRHLQNESDELINEKLHACMKWQIRPILCIGEEKKIYDASGETDDYQLTKVRKQLNEGLAGVKQEDMGRVVVAYEPVWAIGTSNPASSEYATQVIRMLRDEIGKKYPSLAERVKILYGGSVSSTNAGQFLKEDGVDGLLVGSASVKVKEFVEICRVAATCR